MLTCPNCGYRQTPPSMEEPPVGTWVKDRHGAVSVRVKDGWAPAPTGFYGTGVWEAMWAARGPLEVRAPWWG